MPLPGGLGAMKVTTGMYFLPTGNSTQQTGVASDIRVPSPRDGYGIGERELDYSLPPQKMPPFLSSSANPKKGRYRYRPVTESIVSELGRRSARRIAANTAFSQIAKELKEAEETEGVVKLADILDKSKKKKKKKKKGHGKKDEDDRKTLDAQIEAVLAEAVDIAADFANL